MSERELEQSIVEEDSFFQYILEKTYSVNESEDAIGNDDAKCFYEEDNLDALMSKVDINLELNAKLTFVASNRGGRKLLHDGYSYVRDRGDFQQMQWKCCLENKSLYLD